VSSPHENHSGPPEAFVVRDVAGETGAVLYPPPMPKILKIICTE
jgi:hypothetical protein